MPTLTPKLGLNTWLENEVVDFEEVNENFEKIDDLVICTTQGTIRADYTEGVWSNTLWHYKEYSNNTIEAWTKLEYDSLRCYYTDLTPGAPPYYSAASTVYLPFAFTNVEDVQLNLVSNTIGWTACTTGEAVLDQIQFRVMSMSFENTDDIQYKQVFMHVKGAIA